MKVAIISQARFSSSRLPGKVLRPIGGRSILSFHLKRLLWSGLPVVLATTGQKEDNAVEEECRALEIPCFRGEETDVLGRFYHCARERKLDAVIRVTADCPLIDGHLVRQGYECFKGAEADYLSNTVERTYPRGLDFEIFTFNALERAYAEAKTLPEREHVTPYIWRNNAQLFKISNFCNDEDRSKYRITVDTTADLELVKRLIEDFNAGDKGYKDIIGILDARPDLAAINEEVVQKQYGE